MSNGKQTRQVFEHKTLRAVRAEYLLFLPRTYHPKIGSPWPLMLFLHGSGERGSDLSKVAAHGPPRLVKRQPDFPFVVVSPQCPAGQLWSSEILLALLDDVLARYHVDSSRVYLTGLSMGGYATWDLALAYPRRFAGVAPVCGGGELLPALLATPARLRELRTLGVWAFHGARDPVVPVEESRRMIQALEGIGSRPKLTIYPEAGHDCWTETYQNPELYTWFLEHRRPRASATRTKTKSRQPR